MIFRIAVLLCLVTGSLSQNVFHFQIDEKDIDPIVDVKEMDPMGVPIPCKENPKYVCSGTCCHKNGTANFLCCPYPNGVCCLDNLHCCPMRSHCDVLRKRCWRSDYDGIHYFPFADAAQAVETDVNEITEVEDRSVEEAPSVLCPDGSVECENGQTCCPTKSSGSYKCCQFESAICCNDGLHCCPKDYKCDLAAKQCVSAVLNTHPFLKWLTRPVLPLA